ncbi:putative 2-aminoethylphosphonate ABC transporter permease subunit [Desulfovibrio sulfodismutans]|uniref:Putative 2-aminoethylphosphonate ABC transporter permease subunit n=1 Tax=Desulfolutivibrio sulfodismutans TaxID=63561 RepID=A0A7K3NT28_9BACT|nr:putative 2-aminoethylphosphonate ABC transporter permease subunit [Desulfolutivibrio sulfodismutans]NDY58963.1 putative 2-aminoethylphosphonate ABC transporter permease subunit [Desulfolutivibrio sulfodismutans]QLA12348.1 putative 2-aminoethylphosphonate ABC transporter permease subunit [Desulfolutivibrio sulfodismutans DSM 3696]
MNATAQAVPAARPSALSDILAGRGIRGVFIALAGLWLTVTVALPLVGLLSKSLYATDGQFAGFANFLRFFTEPSLFSSLTHSLWVSSLTTLVAVPLAFVYAYGMCRANIPGKTVFRALAMSPLFAPTLMHGIVLVYLFGKKGLVTTGFFGHTPGFDISLYGHVGIIIAEALYAFPPSFLILSTALSLTDARLYEAAASLGASRFRIFRTVTLPGVKYGLMSAIFISFVSSFTDFGAPKVVGGSYNVLATDIYKHVIGQQNFVMGATVSVILLIPTALAFLADYLIQRRQVSTMAAKAVPYVPRRNNARDLLAFCSCGLISLCFIIYLATGLFASLVDVWPYKLGLVLRHYDFTGAGGGGYTAFFNSLRMSAYSAVLGAFLAFFTAYVLEKFKEYPRLRLGCAALSLLPMALPGLVIGLAYIFFFNSPGWSLLGVHIPNPLNFLYATMGILVLSNLVYFHTVSFLTARTALKQLDREYEAVSDSLGAPFTRLLRTVTLPVCLPAVIEIGYYFFVRSMTTLSAVIFLYSADIPLAAVAVANMDDAGDTAAALAMCVLIVATNLVVRMVYGLCTAGVRRKARVWMQR